MLSHICQDCYYQTKQNKAKTTQVGKDVENLEHLNIGGTVNWGCHYEKQYEGSSKN